MPLSFQARITAHVEESVFMLQAFLFADRTCPPHLPW